MRKNRKKNQLIFDYSSIRIWLWWQSEIGHFDSPCETNSWRDISHGRTPINANSTIRRRTQSGSGLPLTNTPPNWFTPAWPEMNGTKTISFSFRVIERLQMEIGEKKDRNCSQHHQQQHHHRCVVLTYDLWLSCFRLDVGYERGGWSWPIHFICFFSLQ